MNIQKIRYINCCIVQFGKKFGLAPRWAFQYLRTYKVLDLLDKHYEAEHLLPLHDTISKPNTAKGMEEPSDEAIPWNKSFL